MTEFSGQPDYRHDSIERLGVLIVNLGTPEAPTPAAVRRFLADFLGDPRVIELPRWLWWFVLHGIILRIRPARSAHAYRQIWTEQGSPLLFHSRALVEGIRCALRESFADGIDVRLAMTYGTPSIDTTLAEMRASGVRRLLVLPLYPQYSATTTASVFDRVAKTLQRWRWLPHLRFLTEYSDDEAYLRAVADSIEERWQTTRRAHLLFSFHGIPRRYLLAGDPYHCQCLKTARRVSEILRLKADEWSVSFQSQVGREEWLRPYTDEWLASSAAAGRREVTVVCPGFATDCLETLEEIGIRNREHFMTRGGTFYDYVPALNASPAHVKALAQVISTHLQGWPQPSQKPATARTETLERALQQGARQ